MFLQLISELKKSSDEDLKEEIEYNVAMPSSGWCNSSESDVEEAKSLAETWKESNILESLFKQATDEIEVPVSFQNCTGLNHKSRSEALISQSHSPINYKKVVRKCKSHHIHSTHDKLI